MFFLRKKKTLNRKLYWFQKFYKLLNNIFYDIEKDNIFDVSFKDMNSLINGTLKSEWESFEDFLINI